MNVDKMRHQLTRAAEVSEEQRRRRLIAGSAEFRRKWLASLTPEHRAVHENPRAVLCRECFHAGIASFNRQISAIVAGGRAAEQ